MAISTVNYVYYQSVHVSADGVSTYANINLTPTALNASNIYLNE